MTVSYTHLDVYKRQVYGLLLSILIVAISLAMMEMWYVHVRFFKRKLTELQRLLLPFLVIGVIVSHFEQFLFNDINNVFIFVAYGIVLVFMNSLIAIMISFVSVSYTHLDVYKRQISA